MLSDTSVQKTVVSEGKVACPNCSRLHDARDEFCTHCGAIFFPMQTTKLDSTVMARYERTRRIGEATLTEQKSITLEIGTEKLVLPIADSLILGRATPLEGDQPDIDLEPYQAHIFGISRLHLKITRSHDLIYVTDLRSLNGTRLNGMRLMPYQERILRSGDELIIGRLKVCVSF